MSMSKKLTFSLASLVVLFGLVFVPAMAQAQEAVPEEVHTFSGNIPAKGYVIIARATNPTADANGLPGLTADPWALMPDLEKLFREEGGTLLLKATKSVAVTPATTPQTYTIDHRFNRNADDIYAQEDYDKDGLKDEATPDEGDGIKDAAQKTWAAAAAATRGTAPSDVTHPETKEDAKGLDLVITEVMWGLDEDDIGTTMAVTHQWIEIYNNLKVAFPLAGVSLVAKSGRTGIPAPAAKTETQLDRVSNVIGTGWTFDIGQSGSTKMDATKDFVSMYRKERGKDGHTKGHWAVSTQIYLSDHKGSPAAKERPGTRIFAATALDRTPVIFNEIANRGDGLSGYEWIELRNVSDAEANLKNWQISIITAVGTDAEFFNFYDKDIKIPAGGVLLLVRTDPSDNDDHSLAAGFNIEVAADEQVDGVNADSARYLIMIDREKAENGQRGFNETFTKGLPNDGKFVLVLRNGNDKEGTHEKAVDVAGWHDSLKKDDATIFTNLWPFVNFAASNRANNKMLPDIVQRRQHAGIDGTKSTENNDKDDKVAFRDDDNGWTGIGYKRNTDATKAYHRGTPGYDNGALKSDGDAVKNGASVIISEVMYTSGDRSLVQWIELYNTSKSIGVNIDNWSIFVVNHDEMDAEGTKYGGKLSEEIELDGKIPPGQTFLIAGRTGRNDTNLPKERIHNSGKKRTETLLSPYGFQLTLKAKTNEADAAKHETVDTVGNLGPAAAGNRRADAQSFELTAWDLPAGINDQGDRISIVRVSVAGVVLPGTTKDAWVSFEDSGQIDQIIDPTSYGHSTDISSPGHTAGGILPVSLSKFRPERMKDTGEIVIRWITESETNNAGFNILRSETRDGEFTKLNTKLIAGQGTTSERTIYGFTDTSAKPNVVYYYQIQDVSLDGQVQTLRTTHLRGNVTAANKLTTTWAELKSQD
jgi:hypothetical protein